MQKTAKSGPSFRNGELGVNTAFLGVPPMPTLSGVMAWYGPSDIVSSGGLVSQWTDLSGNGLHATQTDNNRKPLVVEDVLNGYPVVRHDGASTWGLEDYLLIGTADVSCRTACIFCKFNSATDTGMKMIFGARNTHDFHTGGGPQILDGSSSTNLRNSSGYQNGVLTSHSSMTRVADWTMYIFTPPANMRVGLLSADRMESSAYVNRSFKGDMIEVVLMSTAITTTERQDLEGYWATKYARADLLPTGHPYKP